MNKNNIIKLVIIVAAFGASGYILYSNFGPKSGSSPVAQPEVGAQTIQELLPNGNTLDFDKVINPNRFQYGLMHYPKLDPNDVGKQDFTNLITPVNPGN